MCSCKKKVLQSTCWQIYCGLWLWGGGVMSIVVWSSARVQALLEVVNDLFEEQTDLEKIVRKIMHRAQTLLKCERCSVQLLEDIESPVCCFCLPSFLWARLCVCTRNENKVLKGWTHVQFTLVFKWIFFPTFCIVVLLLHVCNWTDWCLIFHACIGSNNASPWSDVFFFDYCETTVLISVSHMHWFMHRSSSTCSSLYLQNASVETGGCQHIMIAEKEDNKQ